MKSKTCFKCGIEKDLSCFYVHKEMGDGHLNKCIECTKLDSKNRIDKMSGNKEWKESERKRGRNKYRRLYVGTAKAKPEVNKRWMSKFPEKVDAKNVSSKLKKPFHNAERHHWSYNAEHLKDVIWLTKKEHMKGHRFIIYDQDRKMYRRYDNNELLDTKENHEVFIKQCIQNEED